jgi:septal ring factor EnvC (AmiA/AmiB activator)
VKPYYFQTFCIKFSEIVLNSAKLANCRKVREKKEKKRKEKKRKEKKIKEKKRKNKKKSNTADPCRVVSSA